MTTPNTETSSNLNYAGTRNPDGVSLGRDSTDKITFFGGTPVDKAGSTEDLKDLLVAYGLMTAGGATPLNLDSGAFTCGSQTIADGGTVALGTSTGTKFGTATSQKLGFHGVTPIAQRSTGTLTSTVTTAFVSTTTGSITGWGFSTSTQALQVLNSVNEIIATLQAYGLHS